MEAGVGVEAAKCLLFEISPWNQSRCRRLYIVVGMSLETRNTAELAIASSLRSFLSTSPSQSFPILSDPSSTCSNGARRW